MRETFTPTPNAADPGGMKVAVAIAILYAMLCICALLLALPATQDLIGMERDPLGGIFAVLLAMPWVLLFGRLGDAAGVVAIILAMLLNLAIILGIGRIFSHGKGR